MYKLQIYKETKLARQHNTVNKNNIEYTYMYINKIKFNVFNGKIQSLVRCCIYINTEQY